MPPLKAKEVHKNLCKKGFTKQDGDHHQFRLWHNGKKTSVFTMTSHNSQEIGDELQSLMARQLHLRKNEFVALVTCEISKAKYIQSLIERGIIIKD